MIPQWILDVASLAPWLALLILLIVVIVKLWPYGRRFMRFIDDVAGEPERPGFPAKPGLMERVARIEHEVKTNHGTSLKDAVKRIETGQIEHRAENEEKFLAIDLKLAELADVDAQIRDEFENTLNPQEDQ